MLILSLLAFAAAAVSSDQCRAGVVENVIADRDRAAPLILVTTEGDRFRIYGTDFIDARNWRAYEPLQICSDAPPSGIMKIKNERRGELVVARWVDSASQNHPGVPALTRVPDASLSARFRVDPAYPHNAHAKVVGAFAVTEPPDAHLVAAWSGGYLPITLAFSDGRCFLMDADYNGGSLSNGRLTQASCDKPRTLIEPPTPPPSDPSLRLVGSSWGYNAWLNPKLNTTTVTAPYVKTFEPLFTARMRTLAIMAMNGPDYPGGNVTLVGWINGKLMVVTLEVGW